MAAAIILIAILLLSLIVRGCESDQYTNSLKDYTANVDAIVQQSDATGRQFFSVLTSGAGAHSVYTSLNEARNSADGELGHARAFSVPDQLKQAHQYLVLALQMRRDGIGGVAANVQQALGGQTSQDAVSAIASHMARFYASDVLYKGYTLPLLVGALRADNIAVGGLNGQQIEAGQFLTDIRWLTPSFITAQLRIRAAPSTGSKTPAPGLHGHQLSSVSVSGTTLQTGSTNTVPAGSTFTLNFANTGQNTETNVVCKITLAPTSGSGKTYGGTTTVPQTTAGQQTSCSVQVSKSAPAGSYTLTATVQPVPGEKNTANNTLTFPVAIQ